MYMTRRRTEFVQRQGIHVDEMLGQSEPEIHHRHQALPTCQRSPVLTEFRQEIQGVIKVLRSVILERGREGER